MLEFFKYQSDPIIVAKIISKPTDTRCIVQDWKGRQYDAESDGSYSIGQTVQIKNGVIIGKKKVVKTVKSFVV